jgi:hypothetical protein
MKALLIGLTTAATLGLAVPASAQVYFGAGPGGVGVGIGAPRYYEPRAYYYGDDDDCRTVRQRVVTSSGRVIYRTRQVCD